VRGFTVIAAMQVQRRSQICELDSRGRFIAISTIYAICRHIY